MSRSKKKKPILSICNVRSGEMKYWKKKCSKKIRKKCLELEIGNFNLYRKDQERWFAPDDGKFYCHKGSRWVSDPKDIQKHMRK